MPYLLGTAWRLRALAELRSDDVAAPDAAPASGQSECGYAAALVPHLRTFAKAVEDAVDSAMAPLPAAAQPKGPAGGPYTVSVDADHPDHVLVRIDKRHPLPVIVVVDSPLNFGELCGWRVLRGVVDPIGPEASSPLSEALGCRVPGCRSPGCRGSCQPAGSGR